MVRPHPLLGASLAALLATACAMSAEAPVETSLACSEGTAAAASEQARPEVVFLGSSSAAGHGASTRSASYAWRLSESLSASRPTACGVNLARGGYTTWHLRPGALGLRPGRPPIDTLRNIDAAVSRTPRLVVIHLPSNDPALDLPLDESLGNIAAIVAQANSVGVRVLVVGSQPRPLPGDTGVLLRRWARALDTLSAVETVDVWDSLALDSTRMKPGFVAPDGIHLNDAGHAVVYRQVLRSRTWRELFGTPTPP